MTEESDPIFRRSPAAKLTKKDLEFLRSIPKSFYELREYVATLANFAKSIQTKKGERGLMGLTGSMGPRGQRGEQGPRGEVGSIGERGPMGERGPKGEKGEVGKRGPKGKDGRSLTDYDIKKIVNPAIEGHEQTFDHSLLHDPFLLGTKKIDESNIGKDKVISFNGKELIYRNLPESQPESYIGRTGVSAITQLNVNVETFASDDTLDINNFIALCDCTSNAITITLPSGNSGQIFHIKKIDSSANSVTVDPNGNAIDDKSSVLLTMQYDCVTIVSDGSNWFIV